MVSALAHLKQHVDQGEIVCLLGGNASAKSTTMNIILGLIRPRSGDVVVDRTPGHAAAGLGAHPLRSGVGPRGPQGLSRDESGGELAHGAYLRSDAAVIREDLANDPAVREAYLGQRKAE